MEIRGYIPDSLCRAIGCKDYKPGNQGNYCPYDTCKYPKEQVLELLLIDLDVEIVRRMEDAKTDGLDSFLRGMQESLGITV